MNIWVDADACPNAVKDMLFRAAERVRVHLILIANQPLRVPPSRYIDTIQVAPGFDVADKEIVQRLTDGDLVITADIPLAAEVIDRGGYALNPRGEFYTKGTIREYLSLRNFVTELRDGGIDTGGPAAFGPSDCQAFANQLDRFLVQQGYV